MARFPAVILVVATFLLMLCIRDSISRSRRRLASGNLLATLREEEHSVNEVGVKNTGLPG